MKIVKMTPYERESKKCVRSSHIPGGSGRCKFDAQEIVLVRSINPNIAVEEQLCEFHLAEIRHQVELEIVTESGYPHQISG